MNTTKPEVIQERPVKKLNLGEEVAWFRDKPKGQLIKTLGKRFGRSDSAAVTGKNSSLIVIKCKYYTETTRILHAFRRQLKTMQSAFHSIILD
jgi:hypothetical protein